MSPPAALGEAAIRTEALRKVYVAGFLRRKHVGLHGLDLEVMRGETFGCIGPNGAGKTTTIKLLMGLNFPTSGRAEVLGQPIGSIRARARIGYLPERPYFYDHLTAEEFLHFYGQLYGVAAPERRRRIEELLALVHMEQARRVQLRRFSKGMLQRIGLAQALIGEPELVILDEPSSGLDPMGRMLVRDVILSLRRKGVTILLSSHILSDVEEVCDRVAILAGGRAQQIAKVDDLVGTGLKAVEVALENLSQDDALALGHGEPIASAHGRVTFSVPDSETASRLLGEALLRGARVVSVTPRRQSLEQLFVDEMTAIERIRKEKPIL